MCKYSIITVCRNAENEIGKTLESVLSQKVNMDMLELVIVDGLSNDCTKQMVDTYRHQANKIGLTMVFNSEQDNGIYDAMNKGARLAKGEWCLYLNAGDRFFNNLSLSYLIECNKESFDIIYGDTVHSFENRYAIKKARPEQDINFKGGMEFCHQSCIIRKDYLLAHPYSNEYRIAGDCDFFTRAFINKAHFHYIPKIISIFEKDGISSTNGGVVVKENAIVKYKYGLIKRKEYEEEIRLASMNIRIRALIPKFVIKLRQRYIMRKATSHWKTYEEVYAEAQSIN